MTANDDIDFGLDLAPEQPAPSIKGKVKAAKEIDPEDDRANWPTIRIDAEEGMPNYAYVSANGTKKNGEPFGWDMQIMRGVDVQVPPSIVYCLQDAVATHIFMRRDPITGRNIQERQNRASIPWRLVRGGKYLS